MNKETEILNELQEKTKEIKDIVIGHWKTKFSLFGKTLKYDNKKYNY